jgi:hypothetical protein
MNGRLPIVAALLVAGGVALGSSAIPIRMAAMGAQAARAVPDRPGDNQRDSPAPGLPTREVADESQGQRLLDDAARHVFGYESISARIRLRIDMFDQHLVGSGMYYQLGPDEDKLLRLELQIPLAERVSRLVQVCDGRFLWRYENLPWVDHPQQGRPALSRVDLRHVRAALRARENAGALGPAADEIIRAGLANLLRQLSANFEFRDVQSVTLSGTPIWLLRGRWNQQKRIELLPDQKDQILAGKPPSLDALPSHLPHEVAVSLGRNDYFPYRIQFVRQRDADSEGTSSAPTTRTVLLVELFDVAIGDILDPRLFQFKPTDVEFDDRTEQYFKELQQ